MHAPVAGQPRLAAHGWRSLDPTGRGQARWKAALNAFDITFDGRLSATRQ
ncbi:hypothetical protein [Streptomyces sp. NBC_01563]